MPPAKSNTIHHEEIIIRPATTTRKAIKIIIDQRLTDEDEIAMSTATVTGVIPVYFEKPDLLDDLSGAYKVAAYIMRKWNKNVKNGK